jgi:hypothetical protein
MHTIWFLHIKKTKYIDILIAWLFQQVDTKRVVENLKNLNTWYLVSEILVFLNNRSREYWKKIKDWPTLVWTCSRLLPDLGRFWLFQKHQRTSLRIHEGTEEDPTIFWAVIRLSPKKIENRSYTSEEGSFHFSEPCLATQRTANPKGARPLLLLRSRCEIPHLS